MHVCQGIPDVSAQADLFRVIIGGEAFLIGGTSAATPTFSAFISLLNDVRLNAGRQPLGFLNPFLYSKGFAGLNDITVGNNGGCGTPGFNVRVDAFLIENQSADLSIHRHPRDGIQVSTFSGVSHLLSTYSNKL